MHAQGERDQLWLLLAMASTLAGNLTIIGSVANLIVLEVTKGEVRIGFMEYFKVGAPVTLLTIIVGIVFLR
jgi:Na+/H+ antiporter NhaD/arsenite permease-like protein